MLYYSFKDNRIKRMQNWDVFKGYPEQNNISVVSMNTYIVKMAPSCQNNGLKPQKTKQSLVLKVYSFESYLI